MQHWIRLASALAIATLSFAAQAADEVKLKKLTSVESCYKGCSYSASFEVLVANPGYQKQVDVHVQKADGNWIDVPLNYARPASNGQEIWSGNIPYPQNLTLTANQIHFALKYQVNGQTYWDNNNWANYNLDKNVGTVLFGNLVNNTSPDAERYLATGSGEFYGAVTVKNLAPTKQIEVKYSTDGWQTSKSAWATFNPVYWSSAYSTAANPNSYGYETWNFKLDVGNATQVEYDIGYTANGQTYWDNNYGRNYFTRIVRY